MFVKKIICYFCLFLTCSACTDEQKIKKALKGMWSIDTYAPSNDFFFQQTYCINVFIFKDHNICDLPSLCENREGKEGKWTLSKEEDAHYITIDAVKNDISGKYRIVFDKDHANNLLKLYLMSDSNTIVCSKFMNFLSEFERAKIPKSCELNSVKVNL